MGQHLFQVNQAGIPLPEGKREIFHRNYFIFANGYDQICKQQWHFSQLGYNMLTKMIGKRSDVAYATSGTLVVFPLSSHVIRLTLSAGGLMPLLVSTRTYEATRVQLSAWGDVQILAKRVQKSNCDGRPSGHCP